MLRAFTPEELAQYGTLIESCEASSMSFYCNAEGKHYPCSFLEDEDRDIWKDGIDLLKVNDFLTEVWNHPSVRKFGDDVKKTSDCGGNCCHFSI